MEGTIKQLDHATTYEESTKVVMTTENSPEVGILAQADPYMPGEVTRALTRSYQVKQFVWSTGDGPGTTLATLKFPYDLIQLPFLADKVKWYAFFRSKVKVTFRVNSTKFDYGALMIGHLPFYQAGSGLDWRMSDLYHLAQCNPKILSAQQGSTIEFEMPWVNPKVYALTSSPLPEIGTVVVKVLHKLASASSDPPSSITITVFANFVDPELAGFAPDTTGPLPSTEKAWQAFVEDRNKTIFTPAVRQEVKHIKRLKVASDNVKGSAQSKKTVTKEAENKDQKGVLTGIAEGVATIAPLLTAVPVIGEFAAPAGLIAGALSPIFKALGLNKPTSMHTLTNVLPRGDPGLALGRGLDYPQRLALDPENMVSVAKGLCGPDSPQPKIIDIVKTPALLRVGYFNNTTSPNSSIIKVPAHSCVGTKVITTGGQDYYAMSHMGYYSSFASKWRGSLKMRIHFVTSSFVTCRVRISHLFEALSTAYDQVSGDLVSKIVDIAGDTVVDFTIPYLHTDLYLPTRRPNDVTNFVDGTGVVDVSLVNPVVSIDTTANPVVYYSIWIAAGDDYRLMQFQDTRLYLPYLTFTNPLSDRQLEQEKPDSARPKDLNHKKREIGEAQCDVSVDFKRSFPGLIPTKYVVEAGIVNGEDFGTLNTLLHRYVTKKPLVAAGLSNVVPGPVPPNVGLDTHVALLAPFQFWRGASRWFELLAVTDSVGWLGSGPNDYISNGVAIGGVPAVGLYAEFPWYDQRLFVETCPTVDTNALQSVHVNRPSDDDTVIVYSMGDDFSVGSLAATPWWHWPTPPVEESEPKRMVYSGCDLTPYAHV